MPENVTPLSVLSLLKDIERHNGHDIQMRSDLHNAMHRIARHFFAEHNGEPGHDLDQLASDWIRRAQSHPV